MYIRELELVDPSGLMPRFEVLGENELRHIVVLFSAETQEECQEYIDNNS